MAPGSALGLPMAAALGFAFGIGPCLASCLPWLAPVFLAAEGGPRQSWRILLPLFLGRLAGYAGLGLAAGLAGSWIEGQGGGPGARLLLGSAGVMLGLALLFRSRCGPRRCTAPAPGAAVPLRRARSGAALLQPGGLVLMGVGLAFNPCAPLAAVLLSAAAAGSAAAGAALGLAFGLGAVLVPGLVYGLVLAHFGSRLGAALGEWQPAVQRLGAALLIFAGSANIFGGAEGLQSMLG